MVKQIFVNLPVRDLEASINFFKKLGFEFDAKFTDENATCMIIGKNMYAMILTQKFFRTFTSKEIVDSKKYTEVLLSLQMDSKSEVDDMIKKAIFAGGIEPRKPQDQGWMYGRSFEDLDGHIWEVFYMDITKMPKGGETK